MQKGTKMTATAPTTVNAFNGTYTIQNKATGEHRTFAIRTQPADAKFAPNARVVSLMTGPDNESSYTGFGFLDSWTAKDVDDVEERTWVVKVWKSKRGQDGKLSPFEHYARILANAINTLAGDAETLTGDVSYMERQYTVQLAKRCMKCNRKLTTPASIAAGIGPECAKKGGF
jgi:hypothetical protein